MKQKRHRGYDIILIGQSKFRIVPLDRVNGQPLRYVLHRIAKPIKKTTETQSPIREYIMRKAKETPDVLA